ncbi:MAG: putative toxin-antitoxin system toxin component, PIN family [Gammaproteobacteria bacterium]
MKADPSANYARVVVDTNVLLSAALSSGGVPALLVDQILETGRLVLSEATFSELETRIWHPKFDRYLPIERRRSILQLVQAAAIWVDISADLAQRSFSRDASDDAFIQVAIAATATRLISGDDDLLCLHPLSLDLGVLHILTPRQAWEELRSGG